MKKNYSLWLLITTILLSFVGYTQNHPKFIKFNDNEKKLLQDSKQVLKQSLNIDSNYDLIKDKSETDQIGFTHEKYQQFFKGVKVEFGKYIVHAKNGIIQTMNGELFDTKTVNTTPTISNIEALTNAINYVGAQKYLWQDNQSAKKMDNYQKPKGKLVILPGKILNSKISRLAYKFDIYAIKPVSRAYIYIDAHTGVFLYKNNIIKHTTVTGTAATRYSGTKSIKTDSYSGHYRLREYSRGNGIETYDMNTGTNYNNAIDFTDNDNNWTNAEFNNTAKDNAALDAHYGAQMTYDYWLTKHNRNSYDGNGAKIKSYVHYGVAYDNAYWNGSVLTYGDGSGTYFDALTSLDVVAHEFGHAVMSSTADLIYSYESGALNEAFSDIWGASVEYFAEPNKQTWLIGEDIERRSDHAALRSMSNPKSEGQPDTYQGTNWYTGSNDHGGVHRNSGVLNYWYYLVSVGGNGTNDNDDAYSVTGITIDKAAKIAFRMERFYLWPSSNYADARTVGIQSAIDLYGSDSAEEIAVTNAFYAVGIGSAHICPVNIIITQNVNTGVTDIQESSNTIIATNTIFSTGIATYDAGTTVYLKPNFHAKHGSHFRAFIEGCQAALLKGVNDLSDNKEIVSKNNTKDIELIKLYPNPTKGILTIESTKDVDSWMITDAYGKSYYRGNHTKSEINMSNLPKGIYFLKAILTNGKVVMKKVVKN